MRLEDLGLVVSEHASRRFLEKRGFAISVGAGLQAPGALRRARLRAGDTEDRLQAASEQQLDDAAAEKRAIAMPSPPSWMGRIGQGVSNVLGHGVGGAGKAGLTVGGLVAAGALGALGKELGSMGAGLLQDIAAKAQSLAGSAASSAAHAAILQQLKQEDPVLANADDKALMEAYHTMQRLAPTASTDKNLVRSFLRQAVIGGGGLDFTTAKLLAETERAINNTGRVE